MKKDLKCGDALFYYYSSTENKEWKENTKDLGKVLFGHQGNCQKFLEIQNENIKKTQRKHEEKAKTISLWSHLRYGESKLQMIRFSSMQLWTAKHFP